jgi:hypothetical protein
MDNDSRRPSPEVITSLDTLGRSGEEAVPQPLANERVAWQEIGCGIEPWETVARTRTPEQIRDLIRGLVLYSRSSGRSLGGSVSPVIILYHAMVQSCPSWEPAFTRWIITNRTTQWEPFGTLNTGGAMTYLEFVAYKTKESEVKARRSAAGKEQQAQDQRLKQQRDRTEATQRIAAAVMRGDLNAVKALLGKGAIPSEAVQDGHSLVELAVEHRRPEVASYLRSVGIK